MGWYYKILLIICINLVYLPILVANQVPIYPWVPISPDQIQIIEDAKLDLALRVELIKKAKKSIDIVIFEQAADPNVGLPILSALRDAANRGVKVRLATSWLAAVFKDTFLDAEHYLTYPSTRRKIDVVVFGHSPKIHQIPFQVTIHEKILIVDRSIALLTGRGHSSSYIDWLDTSFLIKGNILDSLNIAFEQIWSRVCLEFELFSAKEREFKITGKRFNILPEMSLHTTQSILFDQIKAWLESPGPTELTDKARILHFNMMDQLAQNNYLVSGDILNQSAQYDDPVIDSIVQKLYANPSQVRFTTLSIFLNPKLKEALIQAAEDGTKIAIQTNGEHSSLEPFNLPWNVSLGDMNDLLKHPNITIFATKAKAQGSPWSYLHRKLAIIDDTVIFGSHNLNFPSSVNNDELSIEIKSLDFAKKSIELFDRDVALSSEIYTLNQSLIDLISHPLQIWIGQSFSQFF